jgi:carboxynorspermidine decarboxylase
MMETQSTGAGRFAQFDLSRVPSPCFVVDEVKLRDNLAVLKAVSDASGAHILLALKAFSMWSLAPLISDYLAGTCASGLWEAKLARAHYGGRLTTYAPAFKPSEFDEIASLSDHVVFNALAQFDRFRASLGKAEAGLRINPEHSEGEIEKYDPCAAGSRLGQPVSQLEALPDAIPGAIRGLHMHTLCEQGFAPLARTVQAIRPFLETQKGKIDWLNLGGGHLLTRPDYERDGLIALLNELRDSLGVQTYLELGTSVAFDAGILVGEVLDVTENNGPVAILDISATAHMPDVIEAPYRPALLGEGDNKNEGVSVRLGGPSCLAGDTIGDYAFQNVPQAGQRLAFLDQAHYSMVKTTTFNGIKLPSIAIWNSETDALRVVKQFDYTDFEGRLS